MLFDVRRIGDKTTVPEVKSLLTSDLLSPVSTLFAILMFPFSEISTACDLHVWETKLLSIVRMEQRQ